ncbi:sirohydrochlorin chelatase [Georgenia sp. Z1491]|uniref:sirohydrochlorin chelatase n=1 Tax=Georgenia sp. Z1491 TaxID=3416707 RepID=UPI003CEE5C6F
MTSTVLIGCSHGTSDPAGRAAIRAILSGVRSARPGLAVREAFVDVQRPEVSDVVRDVVAPVAASTPAMSVGSPARGRVPAMDAVVVPLLLSGGYHVNVDVSEAVRARPNWAGRAAAAPALGPDPRLVEIALDRIAEAGARPGDAIVVAAAGSSRPEAARDVDALVREVGRRHAGPVSVGYGAIATPSVAGAVRDARSGGRRVVVLAYLLAPGFFYDRVAEAGGDVVTAPLGPDPRLVDIVLDRFDREVAARVPDAEAVES